jgi:SNF2 family DNA or RNA helicase
MEIIDNSTLLVRTRNPHKILTVLPDSLIVEPNVDDDPSDIFNVLVRWGLHEAHVLKELRIKNVPSPMQRDYIWPGLYSPMAHQRVTSEFLTLNSRAFCFNEQGTGKTAAAIWAADYLLTHGYITRVLVICPMSIMQVAWQKDLFQFAIHRTVGIAHGDRKKRRKVIAEDYEFVVINYDGIDIVLSELQMGGFDLIIVDEANAYKNPSTQRWKSLKKLVSDTTWVWMMTGTPAAQSPVDAYGLAKMIVPNSVPKFFGAWRDQVMFNAGRFQWLPRQDASDKIFKALQPAIRFEKKDCLDLPDVTFISRDAPLTSEQMAYYKKLKKEFSVSFGDEQISSANAAVNLSKLLQVSCGAVYTDTKSVVEFDASNRLDVVTEIIDECSNKLLVFVPFTHTIAMLEAHLIKRRIPCEVISGGVSLPKRTEIINRFQTGSSSDIKVLLIQPQTAAHGVTLTAADTIIWYAPPTSIEIYLQANARIDRYGQKNCMTVFHISGSMVEERLYARLSDKLGQHVELLDLYKMELAS